MWRRDATNRRFGDCAMISDLPNETQGNCMRWISGRRRWRAFLRSKALDIAREIQRQHFPLRTVTHQPRTAPGSRCGGQVALLAVSSVDAMVTPTLLSKARSSCSNKFYRQMKSTSRSFLRTHPQGNSRSIFQQTVSVESSSHESLAVLEVAPLKFRHKSASTTFKRSVSRSCMKSHVRL